MADTITDPQIEILAILLYMEDGRGISTERWTEMHAEDREIYRRLARGEDSLADGDEDDG